MTFPSLTVGILLLFTLLALEAAVGLRLLLLLPPGLFLAERFGRFNATGDFGFFAGVGLTISSSSSILLAELLSLPSSSSSSSSSSSLSTESVATDRCRLLDLLGDKIEAEYETTVRPVLDLLLDWLLEFPRSRRLLLLLLLFLLPTVVGRPRIFVVVVRPYRKLFSASAR